MIVADRKIGNTKIQVVTIIKKIIRTALTITSNINNSLTSTNTTSNKREMMYIRTGLEAQAITNLTQINSNSTNTIVTIMTNNSMTEMHNTLTNSGISHIINTPINSQWKQMILRHRQSNLSKTRLRICLVLQHSSQLLLLPRPISNHSNRCMLSLSKHLVAHSQCSIPLSPTIKE